MSDWKAHGLHYSANFFNKKIYMILQSISNDIKVLVEGGKALSLCYSHWTILFHRTELHPESSPAKSTELITGGSRLPRTFSTKDPTRAKPSVLRTLGSREPGAQASVSTDTQLPHQHSLSPGFTKSEEPRRLTTLQVSFFLKMGKLRPVVVRYLPRSYS